MLGGNPARAENENAESVGTDVSILEQSQMLAGAAPCRQPIEHRVQGFLGGVSMASVQPELSTNRRCRRPRRSASGRRSPRATCSGVPRAKQAHGVEVAPYGDLRPNDPTGRGHVDLMVQFEHVGPRGGHVGQDRHGIAADVQRNRQESRDLNAAITRRSRAGRPRDRAAGRSVRRANRRR